MKLELKGINIPKDANVILGQAHFIKTIEDIYEIIVSSNPNAKFGIAFSEASGDCLVRSEGNNEELVDIAVKNLVDLACGHSFIVVLKNAFPINVLNAIKNCQEVASVFCASANEIKVVVAYDDDGNGGILGVIDGLKPKGIENLEHKDKRKSFLRKIGYKLS
ncbi:adenosine-specific kinase [Thermodesulfobium sp.]|jgi:adenosine/AMP kinase|uniref:Adenosine monophosphate-protein transferase n=1 Tax=Thermodesulfobium narugense TaxID=184064 RepID=A0A7C5KCI0_9BACT